MFQYNRIA